MSYLIFGLLMISTGIFVSRGIVLPYLGHLTPTDMNFVGMISMIAGLTAGVVEAKNKKWNFRKLRRIK